MLVAVLLAVMASASSAPAQQTQPKPSPQELWQAYPLDPPSTGPEIKLPKSSTGAAAPTATPTEKSGGGPPLALIGVVVAAVFVLGVFLGTRPRTRIAAAEPEPSTPTAGPTPDPFARPATRASGESPEWPAPATEPPEWPAAPAARRFRPRVPIPAEAWSCDIAWQAGPSGAAFRALARGRGGAGKPEEIARSATVEWPPLVPPRASSELVAPARALVAALVEAGWQPTDRGDLWYSQRFVWTGSDAPAALGEIAVKEAVEHG